MTSFNFGHQRVRNHYYIYNPVLEKFVRMTSNQFANQHKVPILWSESIATPIVESNINTMFRSKKPRSFKVATTSEVYKPGDYDHWVIMPCPDPNFFDESHLNDYDFTNPMVGTVGQWVRDE